jgi:hypothetical protein
VLTVINFVAALIMSWVVVYAIFGLTLVAVRSVWWTVRVISWFIVHASLGVMLLVVYPVRWMAVAWLGEAQPDSIVAPVVPSTGGNRDVLTPPRRPTFPDAAVSTNEASEALFE